MPRIIETIEEMEERLERLINLQAQFPQCNNIARNIDTLCERISELKAEKETEEIF